MGERNRVAFRFPRRDAEGRAQCVWCGVSLSGRRLSWCSAACVFEFTMRKWPARRRAWVFTRDRGRCRLCTREVHPKAAAVAAWNRMAERAERLGIGWVPYRMALGLRGANWRFESAANSVGTITNLAPTVGARFEIDHIQPISLGGGEEPENYRLLCPPCHKRETGRLRREAVAFEAAPDGAYAEAC